MTISRNELHCPDKMFGVRKQEKNCLINNKQIQSGEPTDGETLIFDDEKDSWIFGAGGSGATGPPGSTGPTGPPGPAGLNSVNFFYMLKGFLPEAIRIRRGESVDMTNIFGSLTSTEFNPLITYDSKAEVFKASGTTDFFYSFFVNIRISCIFDAEEQSEISFSLRQIDGTQITSVEYPTIRSSPFISKTVAVIPTRVFAGGSDLYQTEGFKVFATVNFGPDLELETRNPQEIIFEAT